LHAGVQHQQQMQPGVLAGKNVPINGKLRELRLQNSQQVQHHGQHNGGYQEAQVRPEITK
jgi:hypothetical protein